MGRNITTLASSTANGGSGAKYRKACIGQLGVGARAFLANEATGMPATAFGVIARRR